MTVLTQEMRIVKLLNVKSYRIDSYDSLVLVLILVLVGYSPTPPHVE